MSELVLSILVASSSIAFWQCSLFVQMGSATIFSSTAARTAPSWWLARHHQCQLTLFCTWSRPSSLSLPYRHDARKHLLRCIIAFFALCISRSRPWPSCVWHSVRHLLVMFWLEAECLRGETGQVLVHAQRLL